MSQAAKRLQTKLIVVHVSATPPQMDIGVSALRRMHRDRGWSDVGYHKVIKRNGVVEDGRPMDAVGIHVAGYNGLSIGVCLIGGVDANGKPEFNATPEQMRALVSELLALSAAYPEAVICGHRDLSPDADKDGVIEPSEHIKACPCFDVIPWSISKGLPAAPIKGKWSLQSMGARADIDADSKEVQVAIWQRLLMRAGYSVGPIDGVVGKKTTKAIRAFQMQSALPMSGLFDPQTVARLLAVDGHTDHERRERDA